MSNYSFPVDEWTNKDDKAKLFEILKAKSYVEGEVTLASGKKSDFYIDCRQTSLDPEGATLIGKIFYSWIEKLDFKPGGVGGMTMGADPLSTATSMISFVNNNPISAFIIRKKPKGHGMQSQMEGKAGLEDGATLVMLEDVVTTGGSTLKAIDAAEADGYKVGAVFVIVDRMEGGMNTIKERGIPVAAILNRKDFKGE